MPTAGAPAPDAPLTSSQVLDDEYRYLHGTSPPSGDQNAPESIRAAQALAAHEAAAHSALCLSGGGVRSASFNLGVLQGLAATGVLGTLDYLSTVSGGGYIGGWLSAWRTRAQADGQDDPIRQLSTPSATGAPEPPALVRLRRSFRFLDPRVGVRSIDVWTLGTIIFRNLLLNWAVLVPLLAAAALVPRLYLGVLGLPSQPELVSMETLRRWYDIDSRVILPLFGIAAFYAALELPSLGNRSHGQARFLGLFLAPVLLGEMLVSVHRYWTWRFGTAYPFGIAVLISVVGMVLPWVVGGAVSRRWWRPWTWIAAALAGAIGRTIIWSANHALTELAHERPELFATVDLPLTLSLLFVQITLFVGLASRDMTDEDREWWGRAAAWILMSAIVWLIGGALVIFAPVLLSATFSWAGVSETAGRLWLGILTLVTGGAASKLGSSWTRMATPAQRIERSLFVLAAPLIVLLLVLLLATADLRLLEHVHGLNLFNEVRTHPIGASLPEDLLVISALMAVGLLLGRLISVNDFSLHGMYRKRLARTFLGASREPGTRRPNPFTGFDDRDDVPLHGVAATGRPLHVLNSTLNLVAENTLAMQERRSESFTMSPLHCGARRLGYRPSAEYAGGVFLSDAMTISGAAVSPNMGASSKPALTFLLTLFNARLGAWLGNPGRAGAAVWRDRKLRYGVAPLVNEMLGRTSDVNPFVYLSDGGHYENLGLYEMVFRRCRFIVVSDAGCDPSYRFDDLANAIRKIRLDFGVDIEFPDGLGIAPVNGISGARWALGRIRYSQLDPTASDGLLLYLKAALCGDEPVDVANYAAANPPFPHQPTTNQWFDEAQLESYRMLGLHTVEALTRGRVLPSVAELCRGASVKPATAQAAV